MPAAAVWEEERNIQTGMKTQLKLRISAVPLQPSPAQLSPAQASPGGDGEKLNDPGSHLHSSHLHQARAGGCWCGCWGPGD